VAALCTLKKKNGRPGEGAKVSAQIAKGHDPSQKKPDKTTPDLEKIKIEKNMPDLEKNKN
jgi:hypothetical protein